MKLGLGTVQFGLNYGIANNNNICSDSEISQILELAYLNNLKILDTAPSYGNAEKRLGTKENINNFNVLTKIDISLKDNYDEQFSFSQIKGSLVDLNLSSLYGCLCHTPRAITSASGKKLLEHLSALKAQGYFKKIGVSIYDLDEVDQILSWENIDVVQLPLNIFDQRFFVSGALKKLKDKNIEIHVRSAFLQGLLLMPINLIAKEKSEALHQIQKIHDLSKELNCSLIQLCLGFISNIKEVDHIIVGVNNALQLKEIIEAYGCDFSPSDLQNLAVNDPHVFDPRTWL
jgi:aryl-alcohol dehydrogenase-like predicted oxidoreductase